MKRKHYPLLTLLILGLQVPSAFAQGNSPTGWWPFDGNPDDITTGVNDAVLFGDTSYVAGKSGMALRIDNQGGGATMDSVVAPFTTGSFSIAMWVKYEGHFAGHARHEHPFTSGWNGTSRAVDLFAERDPLFDRTLWWVNGQSSQVDKPMDFWTSATNRNQWVHVVLGRDVITNNQHLCVNGAIVSSAPYVTAHNHSLDPASYVGRNPIENGGRSFPGAIDDIQVYDNWIGESGCTDLFASPGTSLEPPGAVASVCGCTGPRSDYATQGLFQNKVVDCIDTDLWPTPGTPPPGFANNGVLKALFAKRDATCP